MSAFFIETTTGQVATLRQLVAAGIVPEDGVPRLPWHAVRGDRDASMLWYAVMRKQVKGVFIGTLCIRHSAPHASLLGSGWQEVPVDEIAAGFGGEPATEAPDGLAGF